MKRGLGWLAVASLVLAPSALATGAPPPARKTVKWRLHFIIGGDNDLELTTLFGAEFIAASKPSDDLAVIIDYDRNAKDAPESENLTGRGFADTYDNWHGCKRFVVTKDGVEEVQELGKVNLSDPKVVGDAIAWGAKNHPAERTALFFLDHGTAWAGWNTDDSHGGAALTLSQIGSALERGRQNGGQEEKFDLVVFAACLMGSLEVARAVAPHAKYLVASEEISRALIFYVWQRFLQDLSKDPAMETPDVGKLLCDQWVRLFDDPPFQVNDDLREQFAEVAKALTFCVVDLEAVGAVASAADALADGMTRIMKEQGRAAWLKIAGARTKTEEYGKSPQFSFHCRDLNHFARNLAPLGFNAERAKLQKAIKSAVTHNFAGPQRPQACGLNVFFPGTKTDWEKLTKARPDYPKVAGPKWTEFLKTYMKIQSEDTDGPDITDTQTTKKKIKVGQMAEFSTKVKTGDGDVAKLEFFLALPLPKDQGHFLIGKYPVKENEGNDFDGTWLVHGPKDQKARLWTCVVSYEEIGDRTYMVGIPVRYTPPSSEEEREISVFYRVEFDKETWKLTRGSFVQAYDFRESGPSPIDVRSGGKMKGVYFVWKKTGEMERWPSSETLTLSRKGLVIEEFALKGKVFAGFEVTDQAGNSQREGVEIEVVP